MRPTSKSLARPATTASCAPCCATAPDVLVLDINLPGRSGLDVLHVLKEEGATFKVLVVSMYPEDQYAMRALKAGASGYLNKGSDAAQIVAAVRTVSQGKKYVTQSGADAGRQPDGPGPGRRHQKLSDRELQTLVMIASGKRLGHCRAIAAQPQDRECVPRPRVGKAGPDEQLGIDRLRHSQRSGLTQVPSRRHPRIIRWA